MRIKRANEIYLFCLSGHIFLGSKAIDINHFSGSSNVTGSNFEITFVSEKHVVEDDVLFTNHLAGK